MHTLSFDEVRRLDEVLAGVIQVHGRGNFPTIEVQPKEFVIRLISKLKEQNLDITDYRLNGSTASYVLNLKQDDSDDYTYNDLDLIFNVSIPSSSDFTNIKNAVLETLMEFLPDEVSKERISSCIMKEAYVKKMVKVVNKQDTWSLISLTNEQGCNIELKFVDTMKRKFQFSVDSFQIILDSLIEFYDLNFEMSSTLFPTVLAESVYGDFKEARHHLSNKLIATKNPEEIRGGGLLKYCNLLSRGFKTASDEINAMEKYMCSRFFIDFKDINVQRHILEGYLESHNFDSVDIRYKYLTILHKVVENSTVCLMGHERRQTLHMIQDLINSMFQPPANYQQITVFYSVPPYLHQQHSSYNPYSSHPPTPVRHSSANEYLLLGSWQMPPQSTPANTQGKTVQCC